MPAQQTATFGRPAEARREHVPGQLIVRVHGDAVRPVAGARRLSFTRDEADLLPNSVARPLEYLQRELGLTSVEPVFSTQRRRLERSRLDAPQRHRLAVLSSVADSESEDLEGISVVSLPEREVTPDVIRRIRSARAIEYVERVPARWLLRTAAADPLRNTQWGLRAIRWFEADRPDASEVRVGVLDTGIDRNHPDLKAIDVEYAHRGLSARDLIGHGTHVAGIVAAVANNDIGIAGVARTKLGVWKIFPDQPQRGDDFFVDSTRYLRALGAVIPAGVNVVNLSIGGTAASRTEAIVFRTLERLGVTVVAAMGNEFREGNPTEYPGAYEGVFAVGSIAESLGRSSFSNTGRHIGLVAPGSNILSTLPTRRSPYLDETDYAAWSGTSMATPHVTGAAALLAAKHPDWTPKRIKERLQRTARKLPGMGGRSFTNEFGSGLLDLSKAL
jgi:hypothetical protein